MLETVDFANAAEVAVDKSDDKSCQIEINRKLLR